MNNQNHRIIKKKQNKRRKKNNVVKNVHSPKTPSLSHQVQLQEWTWVYSFLSDILSSTSTSTENVSNYRFHMIDTVLFFDTHMLWIGSKPDGRIFCKKRNSKVGNDTRDGDIFSKIGKRFEKITADHNNTDSSSNMSLAVAWYRDGSRDILSRKAFYRLSSLWEEKESVMAIQPFIQPRKIVTGSYPSSRQDAQQYALDLVTKSFVMFLQKQGFSDEKKIQSFQAEYIIDQNEKLWFSHCIDVNVNVQTKHKQQQVQSSPSNNKAETVHHNGSVSNKNKLVNELKDLIKSAILLHPHRISSSRSKKEAVTKAFQHFDPNNSGFVDLPKLRYGLIQLGFTFSPKEEEEVLQYVMQEITRRPSAMFFHSDDLFNFAMSTTSTTSSVSNKKEIIEDPLDFLCQAQVQDESIVKNNNTDNNTDINANRDDVSLKSKLEQLQSTNIQDLVSYLKEQQEQEFLSPTTHQPSPSTSLSLEPEPIVIDKIDDKKSNEEEESIIDDSNSLINSVSSSLYIDNDDDDDEIVKEDSIGTDDESKCLDKSSVEDHHDIEGNVVESSVKDQVEHVMDNSNSVSEDLKNHQKDTLLLEQQEEPSHNDQIIQSWIQKELQKRDRQRYLNEIHMMRQEDKLSALQTYNSRSKNTFSENAALLHLQNLHKLKQDCENFEMEKQILKTKAIKRELIRTNWIDPSIHQSKIGIKQHKEFLNDLDKKEEDLKKSIQKILSNEVDLNALEKIQENILSSIQNEQEDLMKSQVDLEACQKERQIIQDEYESLEQQVRIMNQHLVSLRQQQQQQQQQQHHLDNTLIEEVEKEYTQSFHNLAEMNSISQKKQFELEEKNRLVQSHILFKEKYQYWFDEIYKKSILGGIQKRAVQIGLAQQKEESFLGQIRMWVEKQYKVKKRLRILNQEMAKHKHNKDEESNNTDSDYYVDTNVWQGGVFQRISFRQLSKNINKEISDLSEKLRIFKAEEQQLIFKKDKLVETREQMRKDIQGLNIMMNDIDVVESKKEEDDKQQENQQVQVDIDEDQSDSLDDTEVAIGIHATEENLPNQEEVEDNSYDLPHKMLKLITTNVYKDDSLSDIQTTLQQNHTQCEKECFDLLTEMRLEERKITIIQELIEEATQEKEKCETDINDVDLEIQNSNDLFDVEELEQEIRVLEGEYVHWSRLLAIRLRELMEVKQNVQNLADMRRKRLTLKEKLEQDLVKTDHYLSKEKKEIGDTTIDKNTSATFLNERAAHVRNKSLEDWSMQEKEWVTIDQILNPTAWQYLKLRRQSSHMYKLTIDINQKKKKDDLIEDDVILLDDENENIRRLSSLKKPLGKWSCPFNRREILDIWKSYSEEKDNVAIDDNEESNHDEKRCFNLLLQYNGKYKDYLGDKGDIDENKKEKDIENIAVPIDRYKELLYELDRIVALSAEIKEETGDTSAYYVESHVLHPIVPQRYPIDSLRLELERELDRLFREDIYQMEKHHPFLMMDFNHNSETFFDSSSSEGYSDPDSDSDPDPDPDPSSLEQHNIDEIDSSDYSSSKQRIMMKLSNKTEKRAQRILHHIQKEQKKALHKSGSTIMKDQIIGTIQDAFYEPKNPSNQELLRHFKGCMACRTNKCAWKPLFPQTVKSVIEDRKDALSQELLYIHKRPNQKYFESIVASSVINSGGSTENEIIFKRSDLIYELETEKQYLNQQLKLSKVDQELHDAYASLSSIDTSSGIKKFIEVKSLHSFSQILSVPDAIHALEREHNLLISRTISVESINGILDWMLEGWYFGEYDVASSATGAKGKMNGSYINLDMDDEEEDDNSVKKKSKKKKRKDWPMTTTINITQTKKKKTVPKIMQEAQNRVQTQKRIEETRAKQENLNKVEKTVKFGLFCIVFMYFRSIHLIRQEKTNLVEPEEDEVIIGKKKKIPAIPLTTERKKMIQEELNYKQRSEAMEYYTQKAKIGELRKQHRERNERSKYLRELKQNADLSKAEMIAVLSIQKVFRGYLGRKISKRFRLKRSELTAMNVLMNACAIQITKVYRGYKGRIYANHKRKEMARFIYELRKEDITEEEEEYWKTHTVERMKRDLRQTYMAKMQEHQDSKLFKLMMARSKERKDE